MPQITIFSSFSNLPGFKEFQRFVSAFCLQLVQVVNGNLEFVKNVKASGPTEVTFTGSSDIHAVSHGLGIVPHGTLLIKQTVAGSIYAPSGTQYVWTSSTIYLQASSAMTATLYVI